MPTLRDIALRAGCSVNTVSLALRNHPKISQARRVQIRELAQDMGYRPNPLVSALFKQRMRNRGAGGGARATVALLDPLSSIRKTGSFVLLDRIEEGLKSRLEQLGFGLEIHRFSNWEERVERLLAILRNRGICGLVFSHFRDPHCSLDWDFSAFSLAAFGYSLEFPDIHRVSENYAQGIELALQTLKAYGYERPGLAMPEIQYERDHGLRLGAYLVHTRNLFGIDPVPPLVLPNSHTLGPGMVEWYRQHRPDAILCHRNSSVEKMLEHLGLTAPRDVALVNLNSGSRGLSTAGIDIQPRRCGQTLADVLVDQLNRNDRGVPADPLLTLVRSRWVDGEDCPRRVPLSSQP